MSKQRFNATDKNWEEILAKVKRTERWAETIMKVLAQRGSKRQWQIISFRGKNGRESRGIVDVVAIRKDHKIIGKSHLKRGDLFEIILIQLKGGSARKPSVEDIKRLKKLASYYHAKQILLFEWIKNKKAVFYRLKGLSWVESKPAEIFD